MPKDAVKKSPYDKPRSKLRKGVPGRFIPKFWSDIDGRLICVRRIKRRLQRLREDAHVDNYQKELLAQRAVFIALQIETSEREASEGLPFDRNAYVAAVNCLQGLLRTLGIGSKFAAKKRSLKDAIKQYDHGDPA